MNVVKVFGILVLSLALCSCAGKQQTPAPEQPKYPGVSRIEGVSLESVRKEHQVTSGYKNIIINPIQMDTQISTDYPDTASQFQTSIISHLKDQKKYSNVKANSSTAYSPAKNTLLAEIKIIDMRIVSNGARAWGGAMVGSSYMDIYLKLTDGLTHKVILEKVIATHNNAFASAWAVGSENSLPIDMGKIIGEYIYTVAPPAK